MTNDSLNPITERVADAIMEHIPSSPFFRQYDKSDPTGYAWARAISLACAEAAIKVMGEDEADGKALQVGSEPRSLDESPTSPAPSSEITVVDAIFDVLVKNRVMVSSCRHLAGLIAEALPAPKPVSSNQVMEGVDGEKPQYGGRTGRVRSEPDKNGSQRSDKQIPEQPEAAHGNGCPSQQDNALPPSTHQPDDWAYSGYDSLSEREKTIYLHAYDRGLKDAETPKRESVEAGDIIPKPGTILGDLVAVPVDQMQNIYQLLTKIVMLSQYHISEIAQEHKAELLKYKGDVFCVAEEAQLQAGNWVKRNRIEVQEGK